MKVTVCELHEERDAFEIDWARLVAHVREESSELVLLPEIPFCPWFPATPDFDLAVWEAAVSAHDEWLDRLKELAPASVLGTRPVDREGHRLNEGFVWDQNCGYRAAHVKYYVPDVDGAWEASWFEQGDDDFDPDPIEVGRSVVGFQICSELWALEWARAYGRKGVHLIVTPRATEKFSLEKFLALGRVAATVSGTFSMSSNRVSQDGGLVDFGGQGWIVGPDGEVLGLTSTERPCVTVDIDLVHAEQAKSTYPRDILE